MKKFAFFFLLTTLVTVVQPTNVLSMSNIKSQLPSWIPKDYSGFLDTFKLDFSNLHIPGLKLPNITFEKPRFIPSVSTFNQIVKKMKDLPQSAYETIKAELTNFFQEQVDMFKNMTLMIYDEDEKPFKFNITLPDFNLLHLFPDLDEEVTIKLFTKESGDEFDILGVNNVTALQQSHFNQNRNTYILTHGYMASSDSLSCTLVRDALRNTTDSNIITINWSPLSKGSYSIARFYVSYVGEHIGKLINFLYENGLNPNSTTLIGHSLGAHIMGFAGQTASKKVNHTIGLDPAWPLFVLLPENHRLSSDDAQYVEILHTNAGLLGYPFNMGHFDFYPNGGFLQKGCKGEVFSACSHGRSYRYLAEQIMNPDPDFIAFKCESYPEFKEHKCTNESAAMGGVEFYPANQGQYYLQTNGEEPFSLRTLRLE